jgi:hypothetical protein
MSLTPIGSSLAGYYKAGDNNFDIWMQEEFYNVDLEFTVQETQQNLNNGNIFLKAKFTSFIPNT